MTELVSYYHLCSCGYVLKLLYKLYDSVTKRSQDGRQQSREDPALTVLNRFLRRVILLKNFNTSVPRQRRHPTCMERREITAMRYRGHFFAVKHSQHNDNSGVKVSELTDVITRPVAFQDAVIVC